MSRAPLVAMHIYIYIYAYAANINWKVLARYRVKVALRHTYVSVFMLRINCLRPRVAVRRNGYVTRFTRARANDRTCPRAADT